MVRARCANWCRVKKKITRDFVDKAVIYIVIWVRMGRVCESDVDLISALVIHVIHVLNGKWGKRKIHEMKMKTHHKMNSGHWQCGRSTKRMKVCVRCRWVIVKFYSIQLSYSNEAIIFNELIECKYFVRVNTLCNMLKTSLTRLDKGKMRFAHFHRGTNSEWRAILQSTAYAKHREREKKKTPKRSRWWLLCLDEENHKENMYASLVQCGRMVH